MWQYWSVHLIYFCKLGIPRKTFTHTRVYTQFSEDLPIELQVPGGIIIFKKLINIRSHNQLQETKQLQV